MDQDMDQETTTTLEPEDIEALEAAQERGYRAHRIACGEMPLFAEALA